MSHLTFFDDNVKTVIHRNMRIADGSPDKELEIRFSTYLPENIIPRDCPAIRNTKPQRYKFVPVLEKGIFHRVKDTFMSYGLQTEYEESNDCIYGDIHRNVVILDKNGRPTKDYWVRKERTYYHDVFEFNMRVCMSTEQPIDPHHEKVFQMPVKMSRHKRRWSFTDKCVRYDFTEITTQKDVLKESYETELEYIGNRNPKELSISLEKRKNHILFCMYHLLCVIQDVLPRGQPLMTSDRHNVILEYSVLTDLIKSSKTFFIGAQPETLHKRHIRLIKSGYAITEKYDGERGLLFVTDTSQVFILDRRLRVRNAGFTCEKHKGSMLDVELMPDGSIHAFDMLFDRGMDLRGKKEYNLQKRLKCIEEFVKDCKSIQLKQYHFGVISQILNMKNGGTLPTDGYIFVPVEEPYPTRAKWSTLLKWKPSELNTIDFQIAKEDSQKPETELWHLLVTDGNGALVPFDPLPCVEISRNVAGAFQDGAIVECGWDNAGCIQPLRVRDDKNKPNFKNVALDVWTSIHEPVNLADLQDLQTSPFQNLRKFHNRIKSMCINTCIESTLSCKQQQERSKCINVLDLACGRGGDITKWMKHGGVIRYYCGIDNDVTLLKEACDRAKECANFDYTFAQYDLRYEIPTEESLQHSSYDIVSCQFALHYFHANVQQWSHFINIVKQRLVKGGLFTCTLFDGFKVYETLVTGRCVGEKSFTLKAHFDIRNDLGVIKKREFGNAITVSLDGDPEVILNAPREEYLVFSDLLVKRMASAGFQLVKTQLFHDVELDSRKDLDPIETLYSDMGRFYIWEYQPDHVSIPMFNIMKDDEEFWLTVDLMSHDPIDIYESKPVSIHNILKMVTGRSIPAPEDCKDQQLDDIAEYYNLFIGVFDDTTFTCREVHKPLSYFEDAKMVWVRIDGNHVRMYAMRELNQDINITFPSGRYSMNACEKTEESSTTSTSEPQATTGDPVDAVTESLESVKVSDGVDDTDTYLGRKCDRSKGAWTVKELADLCKQRNIKITSSTRKEALVQLLKDHDKEDSTGAVEKGV